MALSTTKMQLGYFQFLAFHSQLTGVVVTMQAGIHGNLRGKNHHVYRLAGISLFPHISMRMSIKTWISGPKPESPGKPSSSFHSPVPPQAKKTKMFVHVPLSPQQRLQVPPFLKAGNSEKGCCPYWYDWLGRVKLIEENKPTEEPGPLLGWLICITSLLPGDQCNLLCLTPPIYVEEMALWEVSHVSLIFLLAAKS